MPKTQEDQLKQELGNNLIEQIIAIRQRRRQVEETWLRSRRAWMNITLDSHFRSTDTSASTYSVPAGRRALERTAVRAVKMLTPNVKWFELAAMNDGSEQQLSNVDQFMWHVLRKRIKSRSNISQLIRCMIMYGLCHLKTSITVSNGQVWPSQRVVDPFAFYTFPETASTPDEADLIFEDFLFSYERYSSFVQRGIVDDIPRSDLTKPDWPYHLTERLAYQGITDTSQDINIAIEKTSDGLIKTGAGFVSLTELWLQKNDSLYQVYIAWNMAHGPGIVGFIKSDYDYPTYRTVIHRPLPGELYTNSMAEDVAELNTMQNDQINKFQDAVDWEQGFVAFNEQMGHRKDSYVMKGRAKWEFGDDPRNALQFINPPITSTNQLRAWQIYLGLIDRNAGGTIGEGQPGRNMPRAGGAVNNLINLSQADIQDVSELVEQEVLTPSLGDIYRVSAQFIPDHQLMRIPGAKGVFGSILKKDDIIGDYEFDWVGSLQFQDEAARSQRLLIFLNLLPQLAPILQQQGYQPNMAELVKLIWRYGLGERGLTDVVVPIQGGVGQQPGAVSGAGSATPPAAANGNASQGVANGNSNGVAGLRYNLPKPASGFVR